VAHGPLPGTGTLGPTCGEDGCLSPGQDEHRRLLAWYGIFAFMLALLLMVSPDAGTGVITLTSLRETGSHDSIAADTILTTDLGEYPSMLASIVDTDVWQSLLYHS
jgi:hypothetical protein